MFNRTVQITFAFIFMLAAAGCGTLGIATKDDLKALEVSAAGAYRAQAALSKQTADKVAQLEKRVDVVTADVEKKADTAAVADEFRALRTEVALKATRADVTTVAAQLSTKADRTEVNAIRGVVTTATQEIASSTDAKLASAQADVARVQAAIAAVRANHARLARGIENAQAFSGFDRNVKQFTISGFDSGSADLDAVFKKYPKTAEEFSAFQKLEAEKKVWVHRIAGFEDLAVCDVRKFKNDAELKDCEKVAQRRAEAVSEKLQHDALVSAMPKTTTNPGRRVVIYYTEVTQVAQAPQPSGTAPATPAPQAPVPTAPAPSAGSTPTTVPAQPAPAPKPQ